MDSDDAKALSQAINSLPEKQANTLLFLLGQRKQLPVPDNAIDVSKNIGSIAKQVAGANITFSVPEENGGLTDGGDCVMSMIFKLKELTE